MDFDLSDTQRDLAEQARSFARDRVAAGAGERDVQGTVDEAGWRDVWRACAARGYLGLCVPPGLSGGGHDIVTAAAILHGFGEGCDDNGLALALNAQIWPVQMPILEFGTADQKQALLPRMLNGEQLVAHGITEATSGSDALALATTASRRA